MEPNIDITFFRQEMQRNWRKEFPNDRFFDFFLDGPRLFGVRVWNNRNETENIELRNATKYEILVEDTYRKFTNLLMHSNGEDCREAKYTDKKAIYTSRKG